MKTHEIQEFIGDYRTAGHLLDKQTNRKAGLELCDIIDQLLAEREWQPIETAPKDGTPVLLFANENIMHEDWPPAYKPVVYQGFWNGDSFEALWLRVHGSDYGTFEDPSPTHWMPLPQPPTNEETSA